MLVDTHCHLVDEQFDRDRAAVVARARSTGVDHTIVVADSIRTTLAAIAAAREHGLSATAGVHPHVASSWTDDSLARIEDALLNEVVVAVGEAGLDYHYDHSPRSVQRDVFAHQLAIASRLEKPIVVHSRSADDDMVAMLRDTDARVVLHSFSSGPDVLHAGLERDHYISFSGMVTFKSWKDLDAVRSVPDNRILVETDAPYLAPVPHRGERNEPMFVAQVAERVAEIREVDVEVLAQQTTENAAHCFGPRVATTLDEGS